MIRVPGFTVNLINVPLCWRSEAQRGVTISSSDAEYVGRSETVTEINFIYYLFQLRMCQRYSNVLLTTANVSEFYICLTKATEKMHMKSIFKE
jgi:hypothetical protein